MSRHLVVAVHKRYISAYGMLQSKVASIGESTVRLVETPDASIFSGILVRYQSALVGRSVVDEQQFVVADELCKFEVADKLRKHAVYASAQRVCHIIYRYYYA